MRARTLGFALACLAFASAWAVLPAPAVVAIPGASAAALLGPLRPWIATVVRLRFEARRRDSTVLGQLADAWRVLALVPESATDFATFGGWFLFDAPALSRSMAERAECVRAGFEILASGRELHPRHARIDLVEAAAVLNYLRVSPERLALAPLPVRTDPLGHAFELLRRALRHGAEAPLERALIVSELAAVIEALLRDDSRPAGSRAAVGAAADELLAEPGLPELLRAALVAARRA